MTRSFLVGAAVLAACACLLAWLIAASISEDDSCHRRGGHMQATSWVWTGKAMVPIDTCVGAHP